MKLHLNLKKKYFMQIADRSKKHEYRLATDYWRKRLENRKYDGIVIKCGYPKRNDTERNIDRPWLGYFETTLTHPEFGGKPVRVFAIRVN